MPGPDFSTLEEIKGPDFATLTPIGEVPGFEDLSANQPLRLNLQSGRVTPPGMTTSGGPRVPLASYAETAASLQEADTPLTRLIAPRPSPFEPRVSLPKVPIASDAGFWKAAGSEAVNALEGVPEFFTSDAGILSVLGARLSPRLVSAGFSADMTLSAFQQAKQAYQNWDKMTPAEKGKATVDILASTVLSGLTGAHAAGVKLPSLRRAEQPLITPPITGEALRQPAARGVPTSIGFEGEQVVPKAAELAPTEPPPVAPKPPAPEAEVAPAPAVVPARDWDLLYENLTDELDSFNPARSTGRINYELNDVAQRFVDYAKADKSGKPVNELVADFAKTDEASKGQISKLRQSVQSIIAQEQKVAPAPPAETGEGKATRATISFETYDEPTGEWQPQNRPIVISKSTIPGDKPWRATVFAGSTDDPVAIAHIQLDKPADVTSKKAIDDLAEQLGRYTRKIKISGQEPKRTEVSLEKQGARPEARPPEDTGAPPPPPTPPAAEAGKEEGVALKREAAKPGTQPALPAPPAETGETPPADPAAVVAKLEAVETQFDKDTRKVPTRNEKEEDAHEFIKAVLGTKRPPKTADEAWSLYLSNTGVKTGRTPLDHVLSEEQFKSDFGTFQSRLGLAPPAAEAGKGEGVAPKSTLPPSARLSEEEIARRNEEQRWLEQQPDYQKANADLKAVKAKIGNRLTGGINTPVQQKMADRLSKAEDKVADVVDRLLKSRAQPPPVAAAKVETEVGKSEAVALEAGASIHQKEEAFGGMVRDKILNAPSFQKLVAAAKAFRKSLHGQIRPDYEESVKAAPWELLSEHSGVMNAKSARAKTLQSLADAVIKEAGLPMKPGGKYRGMDYQIDWDKVAQSKEPTPAAPTPGTKVKEPWEMSAKEYGKFYHETPSEVARVGNFPGLAHKQAVREAIREGKIFEHPDYPDLTPSKQLTPLQKQWRAIKDQVPNKLVLVRLGDFYEAFYGDAKTLSEVGKIALTKRNEVPMAGVPYHAAESYINKLKAAGHDVEVVEDYRTWKAPGTKEGMGGPGSPSVEQGPDRPGGPGWPQSVNEDIMGVRQVTREKQAAVGQPVVATPGEGTNLEKSLADGRARLIRDPAEAERVRQNFDRTGQLSPEDFNVARAKYEQVMAEGRKVAQQHGTMSEEYFKARMEAYTWSDLTKRMQTAWHKLGMGQQGETDIDTGEILDLENEYHDKTGKNFTPGQRKTGKKIADSNKKAKTATAEAKGKLNKHLVAKTTSMSSAESQAQKAVWRWHRMNATTIAGEEMAARGDIWIKAKEYIEKGWDDFDDIRKKLATDLGMPIEQVTRLLAQDKRAKYLADDVWRKQQTERHLKSQAKRWVQAQATPLLNRSLQSIPRAMFGLKVGFHGTVALGTHAPTVAFQPRFWANYVRDFGKMYKMVGSKAYYENQVQDLLRRDNYVVANRAGLVNDPFVYEDYNSPDTAKYFGALTGMGNRGYSVLKILRQDMFDQFWNHLPKSQQIPEMAQALADGINHATGVVKGRAPRGTNLAFFAPRLEASRVMWLAGDPGKAIGTLLNWNKASMGDKYFAMNQLKEKAWVIGTLGSLLALNQGFLSATGSEQKINVTNPFGSDFLKFKVSGMNLSYGNPMITMARLPLRLFVAVENEGKLNKMVYEDENVATVLFEYVRSQMSPFAGTITDLGIGRDYMRKPLPRAAFGLLPGKKNLPRRLREEGIHPYSWPEYASEQLAMIPVQEALKEVWGKDLVMNAADRERSLKALATIIVMGGTGARVSQDYTLAPRRTPATTPSFNTILQEQPR